MVPIQETSIRTSQIDKYKRTFGLKNTWKRIKTSKQIYSDGTLLLMFYILKGMKGFYFT